MRSTSLLLSAVAMMTAVSLFGLSTQAEEETGTTVQVGPDGGVSVDVRVDGDQAPLRERRRERRLSRPGFAEQAPVAVKRYWIGVGGTPLPPAMRAQLDIDASEGLLLQTVAPDSPAAKAGVQQYDILLRANGIPINTVKELADEVGEQGEMKGKITLDLLRKGQVKTIWVAPAERPADLIPELPRQRGRLGELLRREDLFGGQGLEGLQGLLGENGMALDPNALGEMMPQIAGAGVSVQVQRHNDGPAKVTVSQGEKTWEFDEGDEEALKALPADVRPMVEQMLRGRAAGEDFEAFRFGGPGFQMQLGGEDIAGRIRAMQERMRSMRGGFGGPAPQQAAEPEIQLDEAPAFQPAPAAEAPAEPTPADADPVEVEIPAE